MILRFLGTGTSHGVPMLGCDCEVCRSIDVRDIRRRSSIMVRQQNSCLVVDCGPDFRQQILDAKHSSIDALLLTHEHSDHVAGLDDVRAVNYKMRREMPIYADARTSKSIENRFHYAFESSHSGVPKYDLNIIQPGDRLIVGDIEVQSLAVNHGSLPILGYKIGELVYLTDVKTLPEETLRIIKNCKLLVITALRIEEHPTHSSLDEALAFIKEINPDKAYLSHISHKLPSYEQLVGMLPEGVMPAYDGLEITI